MNIYFDKLLRIYCRFFKRFLIDIYLKKIELFDWNFIKDFDIIDMLYVWFIYLFDICILIFYCYRVK